LKNFTQSKKRIEFLHKSFVEYLLAEFYLESILDNNPHYLNLGNFTQYPSEPTLLFLLDMLSIIKERKGEIYSQFIASLHSNIDNQANVLEKLSSNAKSMIEKDEIVTRRENGHEKEKIRPSEPNGFWNLKSIGSGNYYTLILHKWIALFILVKIFDLKKIGNGRIEFENKESIEILINFSGKFIPEYLKIFSNCDLSNFL
jgi:hypothetical protein